MTTAICGELVLEPRLNVTAMAEIVQELVGGGVARSQDGRWVQERAQAAGLGQHERAALEALRTRLHARGAALLDAAVSSVIAW